MNPHNQYLLIIQYSHVQNVFPGEHSEESTKGLLQFTFGAVGSSKLLVDFPVEIGTLELLRTKWSGQF